MNHRLVRVPEALVVGGAVVVFIAAFLPWYSGVEDLIGPFSVSGWSEGSEAWGGTLLLVLAGALQVLLLVFRRSQTAIAVLILALTAVGVLLVSERLLSLHRFVLGDFGAPKSGIYIALTAGAVELVGAALSLLLPRRRPVPGTASQSLHVGR